MTRQGSVVAAAFLAIIAGCAGPNDVEPPPRTASQTTTTTSPVEPWAQEAVDFFEAHSMLHPNRIDWFYAPGIEVNLALAEVPFEWWVYQHVRHSRRVFLSRDSAVVLHTPLGPHATPTQLRVFDVSDGLITGEKSSIAPVRAFSGYAIPRGSADRLEALYTDYLAAWQTGDAAGINRLYLPSASSDDGLFDFAPPGANATQTEVPPVGIEEADARYEAIEAKSWRTGDAALPAVFTAESTLTAKSVSPAYAVFRVYEDSGCDLLVMAIWELEEFVISAEEILYEVRTLRSCAETRGLELPDGWWTGVEVPQPFAEVVTTQLTTTDTMVIEIANASAVQASLVEWTVDRMETAGLEVPAARVIFPPARRCLRQGVSGATLDPTDLRVTICIEHGEICEGDSACRFDAGTQRTVLHEFGHLWLERNVDEAKRRKFLEMRGLHVWFDQALEPYDQGIEQAADIFAWGLAGEPLKMHFSDATPQELTAGFRLLTGVDPISPLS